MRKPHVSIGLTVFNGEKYLSQAIESMLAQSFPDLEIIVADNCSTDGTGEIARGFAACDGRVRYHRQPRNLGLAGNHNSVFGLARGEYFKWAANDDLLRPTYVERCVEALDHHPDVVLAYPRTQFIDADGNSLDDRDPGWDLRSDFPHERMSRVILGGHWMNAITGLIRRTALARTRLMPNYAGGDYRVLADLTLLGKIYEVPEVLFERRLHSGSSSQYGTGGAHPNADWLIKYWTGSPKRAALPQWRLNLDHLRAIVSARLPFKHKWDLARCTLRNMRWRRATLFKELAGAVATYVL
jgi:glycosyltransferase involved in cell wall biosynthesis